MLYFTKSNPKVKTTFYFISFLKLQLCSEKTSDSKLECRIVCCLALLLIKHKKEHIFLLDEKSLMKLLYYTSN
jgi:hypothetical protein